MKSSKLAILGLVLTSALALSGCSMNVGNQDHGRDGTMHQNEASEFSSNDVMFAQMMIPHHQQAVDMGTLAETRASDEEVKTLAAQIKAEQGPEIQEMKAWLSSANAGMHMGHDMGMDGMLSEAEIDALEKATGSEFDRLFVAGMIAHHEGAIVMAQMVLNSANSKAKSLGEKIVESQTIQIQELQAILKRLG
ncbi:MAG: hypothetical protein RLY22_606 [Actinomycetota bacterium]|jgi:uncharacterized protein (DUF305 family)